MKEKKLYPYILFIPALLIMIFVAIPTFQMIRYSFSNWPFGEDMTTSWVGLKNYIWLFTAKSSPFYNSLKVSLVYIFISLFFELVFGIIIALLLNKKIAGRQFVITGFMVPTLLMPILVGLMWRLFFLNNGIVSYISNVVFGLSIDWYSAKWALPVVIFIEIWQYTPFFIVVIYGGLLSIPKEIIDATKVDGASGWQQIRHIFLPLLKTNIIVCIMIRSMWLIRAFDIIYIMYTGGPGSQTEVLGLSVYRALFLNPRSISISSTISVILFISTILFTYVFHKFLQRKSY